MDTSESPELKNVRFAIEELITTEKTYLSRLQAVSLVYIQPVKELEILDSQDFELQFGCWEKLYTLSKKFYGRLECLQAIQSSSDSLLEIGQITLDLCNDPNFNIFQLYLVKFESALHRRAILSTQNKKFATFLIDAQNDPRAFGFSIESLLIEPVIRVRNSILISYCISKFIYDY